MHTFYSLSLSIHSGLTLNAFFFMYKVPSIAQNVFALEPCKTSSVSIAYVIYGKHYDGFKVHVKVTTFQKRGLLTAHCIFLVTSNFKVSLMQLAYINLITLAEFSNPSYPLLQQNVLKYNMHNFCGKFSLSAVYTERKMHTLHIPKGVNDDTGQDDVQIFIVLSQKLCYTKWQQGSSKDLSNSRNNISCQIN